MGEVKKGALRVRFDQRLRLELHESRITSDAGLPTWRGDIFPSPVEPTGRITEGRDPAS